MKKLIILVLLAAGMLPAVFVSCAGERAVVISLVQGKVEVQKAGSGAWIPAVIKMELKLSDKISTKAGARCEITLDDGSVLKLREKTTLEINRLDEDSATKKKSSVFKMIAGKLFAKVEPQNGSDFGFVTPVAIAGIRGTELGITVELDGSSDIFVFKGSIDVKSLSEAINEIRSTIVEAGRTLGVDLSGVAGQLRDITPGELSDWQKFVEGKRTYIINPVTDDERDNLKRDILKAKGNFSQNRRFAFAVRDADLSAGRTVYDCQKRLTRVQQYLLRPSPNVLRFLNLNYRPGRGTDLAFNYMQNDWFFTKPLPNTLVGTLIIVAEGGSSNAGNPMLRTEMILSNNSPYENKRDYYRTGWDRNGDPATEGVYMEINGKPVKVDFYWNGVDPVDPNEGLVPPSDSAFHGKARIHFDSEGNKGFIESDFYVIDNSGKVLGAADFAGVNASSILDFKNSVSAELVLDLNGMDAVNGIQMKNGGRIDVVIIPDIIFAGLEKIMAELGQSAELLKNL